MVLNNFKYWLHSVLGKWTPEGAYMRYTKPLVNVFGEEKTYTVANSRAQSLIYEYSTAFGDDAKVNGDTDYDTNLLIGSGTTPVTENDYKLESLISEGLTHVSLTTSCATTEEGKGMLTFTRTITNTSGNEITIGEIGLFKSLYEYEGVSGYNYYLLAREVLDTPTKVASGETFTVALTIKI